MRAFGSLHIICSIRNHKQPHHPAKVQGIYCFTANVCGRRLPLLSITLQELHFISPPFVSFRSLSASSLGNPRKSASFISFRFSPFTKKYCPAFEFPSVCKPTLQKQKQYLPPQKPSFHSVATLAFPNPVSGMPCGIVHPGLFK
jgi:hypothetical protein